MAKLKHTSGAWSVKQTPGGKNKVVWGPGEWSVCLIQSAPQNANDADAALIAAAPEMLQLLRNAWDSYMADPNPDALGNTMRKVEDLLWRLDGNE